MRFSSAILAATLFAGSCALLPQSTSFPKEPRSAAQVRDACTSEHDPFRKSTLVRAPCMHDEREASFALSADDQNGDARLAVSVRGEKWLFLESAFDGDGRPLVCESVDRRIDGARVEESMSVCLPRASLAERLGRELRLRLYGQRGNYDLVVPEFYLRGFVFALEARSAGAER